jgi:hypothetical protein
MARGGRTLKGIELATNPPAAQNKFLLTIVVNESNLIVAHQPASRVSMTDS